MARRQLVPLLLAAACVLLCQRVGTLLFANAPSSSLRGQVAMRAEMEEGLIKPEDAGKITTRDKNNNPPRIAIKTNDWDQPELQLSTGASNQISYITPVVESEDIKAWLSLNVNLFSGLILFTAGGMIEIQRFFPELQTNDWDQPELQLSTGASNQINYITPSVASEDIKAWLSLNVNFFSILGLLTVGGIIEIQRFFPDTLYW
eukprot:CAMPEP_0181516666 /NCGR_PEP_ID=MMETSP1110-20121109/64251_1 /TAXON_ID=174948 /ORGANISM="Symbiodinium sp., Strain CCMP421" /LENGTH=203 /DNA_ID=CAMNT_0023646809 /DNA_START=51 /DNA_END=662 /DNA_ORIENTATION=+